MIVVTGAAGFIGSCLVTALNHSGTDEIILVDDFSGSIKENNLKGKRYLEKVHRNDFFGWLNKNHTKVSFIFHLGARTNTAEFNRSLLNELNYSYSCKIFNICTSAGIPVIYASSAATYGDGKLGYDDRHELTALLKPLNPYGESKNEFDKYVLNSDRQPPYWAGMKFFNVFGPNEYHKGRMASVVFHAFHQIRETGSLRLFRSNCPDYRDGEQLRDFIYVKDVTDALLYFYKARPVNGIYNIGTEKARSFNALGAAVFNAMDRPLNISYIDMPEDIKDKYQNYTQANITRLRNSGFDRAFITLEDAVDDYVRHYLSENKFI